MNLRTYIIIATAIIGVILLYNFNKNILGNPRQKFRKYVYMLIIAVTTVSAQFLFHSDFQRIFILGLVNYTLSLYVFAGSRIMKLFVTALLVAIIQVREVLTRGVVLWIFPGYMSDETLVNPDVIFAFRATVSYAFLGIAVIIFHFFPSRQYGKMPKKQGLLLSAMALFCYTSIILLLRYLQGRQITAFYAYLSPSFFIIAVLLLVILFYRNIQGSQESASVTAVLNSQLEHFNTRYEEQDLSMKLFRERSHDWKNHLLLIKALSDSGDIAGLREYIAEISEGDELVIAKYTGNPAIDIIFSALSVNAENAGIEINIAAYLAHDIAINAADLCVVISNAVDNAYEACERITDNKKRIDIEIATDKAYLFFTISNTMQEKPHRVSGRFLTSKSDSTIHGIGLQSIRRVVDKYSGHSNTTVKDGIFTLSCVLENVKITDHARKTTDRA